MKKNARNRAQGLRREAMRLQRLRACAKDHLLDAEADYDGLTQHCREAWDEYHKAMTPDNPYEPQKETIWGAGTKP